MREGQRELWWAAFHELVAELTGRTRRRSWRTWGPVAATSLVLVLILGLSWLRFDATAESEPFVPLGVTSGLIGIGAVLVVTGSVLSWRAGTIGGSRYSPTALLRPDQERRCLALVGSADPEDHDQVEAAAGLARRVSVQRPQCLFNAAFVLLMAAVVLGGGQDLLTVTILVVLLLHLGSAVTRELRVRTARRFLRAQGQPARLVPA